MKKYIKAQIDWYLKFAQVDLEQLSKGDLAKLISDAEEMISGGWSERHLTEGQRLEMFKVPDGNYYNFKWLRRLQRAFLKVFEPMMSRIERISEHQESEWKSYSNSKLINGLTISEPLKVSFSAEIVVFGPLEYDESGNEIKVKAGNNWVKQSTISVETRFSINDHSVFVYGFVKCLSGLPTQAFKKCKECQKWFLHLAKRKREYCNNLCAARSANRIRRKEQKENDPAKYELELENSRKRAGKSHKKKVKEIHPNARVKHRNKKMA